MERNSLSNSVSKLKNDSTEKNLGSVRRNGLRRVHQAQEAARLCQKRSKKRTARRLLDPLVSFPSVFAPLAVFSCVHAAC